MNENTKTLLALALVAGVGVLIYIQYRQAKAMQQLQADLSKPASHADEILGAVQSGIGMLGTTLTSWIGGAQPQLPDHNTNQKTL